MCSAMSNTGSSSYTQEFGARLVINLPIIFGIISLVLYFLLYTGAITRLRCIRHWEIGAGFRETYIRPQAEMSNVSWDLYYGQTSHISRTLAGDKNVDHSDVVGQALLQLCLHYRPSFSGLGKGNCKTRRETLKFGIWCDLYKRFGGALHLIYSIRSLHYNTIRYNTIQYNTISFIFSRLQSTNNISWWAAIVRLHI